MHRTATCIAFAALTLGLPGSALSQDSGEMRWKSPTETRSADDVLLEALEKAKQTYEGLVIIGGGFEGLGCNGIEVIVGRTILGDAERHTIPAVGRVFGNVTNFRPKAIGTGEWFVSAVKCSIGRGGQLFRGPYAKFDVEPGEIVDAGFLVINYQRDENLLKTMFTGSATLRLSVGPTPEFRLAELRKRVPRLMALVKKRPMVVIAPAERKVKFKGSIF